METGTFMLECMQNKDPRVMTMYHIASMLKLDEQSLNPKAEEIKQAFGISRLSETTTEYLVKTLMKDPEKAKKIFNS